MHNHVGYIYQATNWLYQGNNKMRENNTNKPKYIKYSLHSRHAVDLLHLHQLVKDEIHLSVSYGDWATVPSFTIWADDQEFIEELIADWKYTKELLY